MADQFSTVVTIDSIPANIWTVLTDPEIIPDWMGEPEMGIKIFTDWKIDSPVVIRGFHHVRFENKGIVLQYEKEKILRYSHLSSVSRLPDESANYSILEFILTPVEERTLLTLNIKNFPTETIRKHLEFYWRTTIVKIKTRVEG